GPPYSWTVVVPSAARGTYRVELGDACRTVDVAEAADDPPHAKHSYGPTWRATRAWDRSTEELYSAWIEQLFDAPLDQALAWPALHEVLRDPKRNALHDYLGEGEDEAGEHAVVVQPDCADLPYFLRAYFSYKLGLPFGYSSCTRGDGGQAPRCSKWHSNLDPNRSRRRDRAQAFGEFLRVTLADVVHSGTGRTLAEDDRTDYYPVPLSLESLRPGTVYADPYGHVLIVVKRIAGTRDAGGVLLAVDGQPDGTVSRRRFWRGNFLFADDRAMGSPGFKRFRPVVADGGRERALTNAEIEARADYGDYSLDQYKGGVEGFYDAMDDVLSPVPLDPTVALLETIDTFEEQVKGRVLSVSNGQKYLAKGGDEIDMPDGPSIFETTGPWEDFSTPSRDLRLLIAIDVVTGFPARVARRPARFAMPAGKTPADVKAELEARLEAELAKRKFTYTRSDGSPFELTLADVVERARSLEMAYNPNDCVEVRWGAPPRSDEAKTCRRRAPGSQTAHMRRYRAWFHERKRPPRS
ncbi:MAG TPA: hypothetical protein VHB21_23090, partial [Minicystis sp.]|nr:hypothetical protein [Minicystis sp.]